MKKEYLLYACGIINLIFAILHVPLLTTEYFLKDIGWGSVLYQANSPFLYVLGLTVILGLTVFGFYAFSAIGLIRRLPFQKSVLIFTGIIFFMNGIMFFEFIYNIIFTQSRINWSSGIIGLVSLIISSIYFLLPVRSMIDHKNLKQFIKEKNICNPSIVLNRVPFIITMVVFVMFFGYYSIILVNSIVNEEVQLLSHIRSIKYQDDNHSRFSGFPYKSTSERLKALTEIGISFNSIPAKQEVQSGERMTKRFSTLTDTNYWNINNYKLLLGKIGSSSDDRVVVISDSIRKTLFSDQNPVGEKIRVGKSYYSIVAVITDIAELKNRTDVWVIDSQSFNDKVKTENLNTGSFMISIKFKNKENMNLSKSKIRKTITGFYSNEKGFNNAHIFIENRVEETMRIRFGINNPSFVDAILSIFKFVG
ncbi:MAG: hypothetical protein GY760_04790 [Deltaproteobacteria bacterium]|nr:hypothetical protein [Deltaproteobacteria bacterium]